MLSDPRSIAFIVDCIHPQVRHDPKGLQKFYADLVGDTRLSYANFNLGAGGAQMSTVHGPASLPGSTSHSMLSFGPDRIQIKEEWPQISVDDFIERARAAAELTLENLPVPMFAAVQCVVRCLVSVKGMPDSREFFNQHFFQMDESGIARLGRNPNLFGLRLVFPASPEDPSIHNVRIESFNGDVRSVFLEECGVYQQQLRADDMDPLETAIRASYDFLTDNVVDYLRHADPSAQ